MLASGRGSNVQAILDAAAENGFPGDVAVVLSDREDAPALDRARRAGVDAIHVDPLRKGARLAPTAEERILAELERRRVHLLALAGFMRILSPRFLDAFPGPVLNIHPSLLPAFPGLHAQRRALDHGVKIAGCTVHHVDRGIDTGPIIAQAAVPVIEGDDEATLAKRILAKEHAIYPEAIRAVLSASVADTRREGSIDE